MNGQPTVTIITSITDGYDTLKRTCPQFGVDVEWVAVTDGTEKAEENHGWTVINVQDRAVVTPDDMEHPNRLAKLAKCVPQAFARTPYTIWLDASYRVFSPLFAAQALACAKPIAQFVHPWRDCIYEEGDFSRTLGKYRDEGATIHAQLREYDSIGHPRKWGLWATGVIARKHTEEIDLMGHQWLREIRRHSFQDQLSEPVALRFCDLRPTPLPGDHLNNPWLSYEGSARH